MLVDNGTCGICLSNDDLNTQVSSTIASRKCTVRTVFPQARGWEWSNVNKMTHRLVFITLWRQTCSPQSTKYDPREGHRVGSWVPQRCKMSEKRETCFMLECSRKVFLISRGNHHRGGGTSNRDCEIWSGICSVHSVDCNIGLVVHVSLLAFVLSRSIKKTSRKSLSQSMLHTRSHHWVRSDNERGIQKHV